MKIIPANMITSLSVSSEDVAFPVSRLLDWHPMRKWKANGSNAATLSFVAPTGVESVMIAGTNAQSATITAREQANHDSFLDASYFTDDAYFQQAMIAGRTAEVIQNGNSGALWFDVGEPVQGMNLVYISEPTKSQLSAYGGIDYGLVDNPTGFSVFERSIDFPLTGECYAYTARYFTNPALNGRTIYFSAYVNMTDGLGAPVCNQTITSTTDIYISCENMGTMTITVTHLGGTMYRLDAPHVLERVPNYTSGQYYGLYRHVNNRQRTFQASGYQLSFFPNDAYIKTNKSPKGYIAGSITPPLELDVTLTAANGEVVEAGVIHGGTVVDGGGVQYGCTESGIDRSIYHEMSNGSYSMIERDYVRTFGITASYTDHPDFYNMLYDVAREIKGKPCAWKLTDLDHNWLIYGKLQEPPQGNHADYGFKYISFNIEEVI